MAGYETEGLLHEMFTKQALATPDKVAIVEASGRKITYKNLNADADILARNLVLRGVKADSCVGIYLNKSIEFCTAYIAILKAGGAYIPLDISYPKPLLESIFSDAKPVAIVTTEDIKEGLNGYESVITLADGWQKRLKEQNDKADGKHETDKIGLDNLAYIVYSSGTTGKPKGIVCPHRGAVFSYCKRFEDYPYVDNDREACNIFFTWEMMRPLLRGVTMYIIPNTVIYDPSLLCQFIKDHHITRMLFTPSLLEAVLNTAGLDLKSLFKTMKQIWFCGEVVTTALMERCIKVLSWIQFVNLYSISECHDVATEDLSSYFKDNKDALNTRKFCPVGKVYSGVHVIIMDRDLKPQPVGGSGEIYVGGPTLARGYLNRPEMNALRFIQRPETVPQSCGSRLYRTGDWGYKLSDGSLEICGRCDSMVKIRGYSIEVQAVEAALMELPMVNATVVLVKGQEGENKFLVAYIVPEGQTSRKQIREELKRRLPFYMIPSYFVLISSIPMVKATGKLDKSALPPFDKQSETEVDMEAQPSTKTEKKVAKIWTSVLQIQEVDIQESFFDLGGHSLLATELLVHIRKEFDVNVAVQDLFNYPTISTISQFIDAKQKKTNEKIVCAQTMDYNLQDEVEKYDQGKVNIDMQLRAFWRVFNIGNPSRFMTSRVLLTGATGYLGAFLLKELLLNTKTLIVCLVRDLPDVSAATRVENTLKQFGILPSTNKPTDEQSLVAQLFKKRVHAYKGDVALRNLGMNEDDYTYLCTDIDFIIHSAASVNLVYPYNALKGANVRGTSNVVLFACSGKIKPIHYVSTNAVFPTGLKDCSEEDTLCNCHDKLTDGYSQSKWVAEQLISRASQRGIPVAIYRLGNMSGDRGTAFWNPQDFTLLILQACAQYGVAPDVDWLMEMTPVDFAAEFIVRLSHNLSLALGKTFHIINDKPLQSRWVFEWMNAHGYPLQILKFEEWKKRILEGIKNAGNGTKNQNIQRIVESYAKDTNFFTEMSTYTTNKLQEALKQLGMEYPYTDSDMLENYFRHLSQRGTIAVRKPLRNCQDKRLNGKVAIVTGASSGIGQAIAMALASEGAKVSMAARRLDRLEEFQKKIDQIGGIAISVKTDVTNREEVKNLVKHTEAVLGPVDVIVNSAGVMYYTMMKNLHEEEWERQIDINCKGTTNCIGAVLKGMLERKSGHIINLSSDAGRKGFPGLAVYSGTKFYVEGMSQALRQEVCGSGIRVTCLQPGDVKTELLSHTTDKEAQEAYDGSTSCKILEPTDIANAVIYAVTQPEYVGVNEILIEPREAPV